MALALSVLFPVMVAAQVTITTTALPVGNTSNTYYAKLAATGGSGTYMWQLANGTTLPAGLSLNSSTGVINGVLSTATGGAPPLPTPFQIEVIDTTTPVPYSATETFYITALPPGSHSLVINQLFTGGNSSTSSPYANNWVEIFNAAPVAIDLQNWTVQIAGATSAFSSSGIYPLGSLDPYKIGTTGGTDGAGDYPAYQISYSAAFAASNCNPAAGNSQLNTNFPASHCWLNGGQFMLVLLGTTATTGALKTLPQITPDLDLTDGYVDGTLNSSDTGAGVVIGNVGAVAGSTIWVGHGVTTSNENSYIAKPNPSDGMLALVNGVGVGPVCPTITDSQVTAGAIANPEPAAAFSPSTADFIGYLAQLSAGGEAQPICWEGANANGFATHVSSSGKNTETLIRSAGNGKINASVTGPAAPAGTLLPSSGVTLTPCGDTDNNLSDFAPISAGLNGQINWVLHNSQQVLTKATTTTLNAPAAYTPTPCTGLVTSGPTVAATFSSPIVPQNASNGTFTETLTVTVTPSSYPSAELFNVSAPIASIAGAALVGNPISNTSIGVPDGNGNLQYTEQFTIPTSAETTFTVPITVIDDAGRSAVNANVSAPYEAQITIGNPCGAPTASNQTVPLYWNTPQPITLGGALGSNCNAGDTLVYALQSGPKNGALGTLTGNGITYTPNAGFAGTDSFTFNVTDTTNTAGALTSTTATVNLVVSATGVPTLSLNCPNNPTYNGFPELCTTSLSPFVAGTTTVIYNGSQIAPTSVGNYSVVASFTANSGASQNASANSTLLIGPATPAITVNCPNVAYDGSPQGCTDSVTGIGGVTPSGSLSTTYNGSTIVPTNAGTYTVVAAFTSSDPNYATSSARSSFTIYEPVVTITVNNQTMNFGGMLPALTYTVTPSVPLDTLPICASTANGSSSAGAYTGAITCSGAAKTGCTIVYVAGNMTVQTAPATVAANNQTMNFSAAVPALTYSVSPSSLAFSTAPTCSTTATSASLVGSYPITCNGAANANYTFTYVAGNLTVQAAPATVAANNQSMAYGGTLPALTYTTTPSGMAFSNPPVCSTTATSASAVGNYPIICSGAIDAGYAFTYVAGNIAVQAAPAIVTANNQSMAAGTTVPALTYTTTPSGLTFSTAPTCSTTATSSSPYGTYSITCSGGVVPNYSLSYVNGTMSIPFAPIVPNGTPVIAGISPLKTTAGSAGLTLTVTGSGFINGASVLWNGTALTTTFVGATQLTATVPAAALTTVGSADVTVSNPAPGGGSTAGVQTFSIDSSTQASGAFTVAPTITTLAIPRGQYVSTLLTFTSLPTSALVSAVCYDLPALASCNYNAATGLLVITTSPNTPPGTYQILVVCTTSNQQSALNRHADMTALCGLLGFPIGLLILRRGRRFRLYGLSVFCALLLAGMIGCSGTGVGTQPPVPTAQVSTVLTLTVQ
jgi:hypothetical protein